MNIQCDDMPVVSLNVIASGLTNETVRTSNGNSILDFYIEEWLGEKEPKDFWLEVRHKSNNTYLQNKTNVINQTVIRSTTAILVGLIHYEPPIIDETTSQETTL